MFRSIGTVILLYFIVSTFSAAASAFEAALVASFTAVEVAAETSQRILRE